MLAVSCRDYDEELVALDNSKAQVVFSVAMDTPMARTRAAEDKTWGDNYDPSDPGTAKDNRIDIDQLIVKIVDGNTEYEIVDIMKWKSGDNTYKFVGVVKDVNKAITLDNAKVYVYANMGKGLEPAETFTQNAEYIPMWGVKNVSLNFVPGKRADAGQISLLRAMAKLEVKLGGEMAGEYELTGATLNKYNNVGNTHPALHEGFNGDTEDLGLEAVLNVNTSDATDLALVPTEDGSSYIVYLPEVENGTSETDWLKISVGLKEKNGTGTEEGSFFIKDYSDADNPVAIDIIRNHWYKYTITGFAASEIQVEYNVLDWQGVEMEIGGDGFLFLNKDVIEIYNSNIDTDQLKFASSSPIKSIELKDIYKHYRNGDIKETPVGETPDEVYAYYMDKYGVLTQLSNEEGSDEAVVLANISATVKEENKKVLNGGIVINSPFMADMDASETVLKSESHNNTIRYLEFLVTNEQGLKATFRVMQYPPVVITNEEGYFSYRDDLSLFSYREDLSIDTLPHFYIASQFKGAMGEWGMKEATIIDGEATHYMNPCAPYFSFAGFFPYHTHEWDPETERIVGTSCPGGYEGFDEVMYGFMERDYGRVDEYTGAQVSGVFHRAHYLFENGKAVPNDKAEDPSQTGYYYQNIGPVYEKEVEVITKDENGNDIKKKVTKYYRRHYTGNAHKHFYQKFVSERKGNGKAVINSQMPNTSVNPWNWGIWGTFYSDGNHRMYHIRTTASSSEYTIGYPAMEKGEGGRLYTAEGEANSRMVSPSFMVASQLGATTVPMDKDGYIVPKEVGLYPLAKHHCEQYVETRYIDVDNDGFTLGKDTVQHYHNWRLPTKAEVEMIINYQRQSRVMDKVLDSESYYCAALNPGNYTPETILVFLDKDKDQWTNANYHIRCVRDVKNIPAQKTNEDKTVQHFF